MELKRITLAVAIILAAPVAYANPKPESAFGVQRLILSGSDTVDPFFENGILRMLDPATIKTYRDKDTGIPYRHRAWYGIARGGIPGVTAGTPLLFVKRSTHYGSYLSSDFMWGVDVVARASQIETLNFASCTTGGAAAGDDGKVYDYFCATKGLHPGSSSFKNPELNNGVPSDFGVSDVSPALFQAPYNIGRYQTGLPQALLDNLAIKPVGALIMGIVATNDVPLTTSISRADYGNMLMGNIQDWTQIDPSLGGNTQVVVCRQASGSGTQAAYNWFFNNFPCQSGFNGTQAPASMYADNASGIVSGTGIEADPFVIDPMQGYTVVNNASSADVRNCLKNAQNHTDLKIKDDNGKWYLTKFSNSVDPFKAIGVLSGDSYGNESGWTFRNLYGAGSFTPGIQAGSAGNTGIAPSKANLLSGTWDFAAELTTQYRTVNVTNPQGNVIPPLTGIKLAFAKELIRRSFSPGNGFWEIPRRNVFAALPYDYYPFTSITYEAHTALGGRKGNMCQPLERKY